MNSSKKVFKREPRGTRVSIKKDGEVEINFNSEYQDRVLDRFEALYISK